MLQQPAVPAKDPNADNAGAVHENGDRPAAQVTPALVVRPVHSCINWMHAHLPAIMYLISGCRIPFLWLQRPGRLPRSDRGLSASMIAFQMHSHRIQVTHAACVSVVLCTVAAIIGLERSHKTTVSPLGAEQRHRSWAPRTPACDTAAGCEAGLAMQGDNGSGGPSGNPAGHKSGHTRNSSMTAAAAAMAWGKTGTRSAGRGAADAGGCASQEQPGAMHTGEAGALQMLEALQARVAAGGEQVVQSDLSTCLLRALEVALLAGEQLPSWLRDLKESLPSASQCVPTTKPVASAPARAQPSPKSPLMQAQGCGGSEPVPPLDGAVSNGDAVGSGGVKVNLQEERQQGDTAGGEGEEPGEEQGGASQPAVATLAAEETEAEAAVEQAVEEVALDAAELAEDEASAGGEVPGMHAEGDEQDADPPNDAALPEEEAVDAEHAGLYVITIRSSPGSSSENYPDSPNDFNFRLHSRVASADRPRTRSQALLQPEEGEEAPDPQEAAQAEAEAPGAEAAEPGEDNEAAQPDAADDSAGAEAGADHPQAMQTHVHEVVQATVDGAAADGGPAGFTSEDVAGAVAHAASATKGAGSTTARRRGARSRFGRAAASKQPGRAARRERGASMDRTACPDQVRLRSHENSSAAGSVVADLVHGVVFRQHITQFPAWLFCLGAGLVMDVI